MIKSKKILATTVMASLLGGIAASYAATVTDTKTVKVEIEVGAKVLKDVLKLTPDTSTKATKRAALDTSKGTSEIHDFLEWSDGATGKLDISVTGTQESGTYVIKSSSDTMPIEFEIGGQKISPNSNFTIDNLNANDKKDLKIIYGDGSNSYPSGNYTGDFDFKIEATF